MENRFRLVVATKAFGLGIDKRDLPVVVHYSLPDSLEAKGRHISLGIFLMRPIDGRPCLVRI
jgi:hypothetical protein